MATRSPLVFSDDDRRTLAAERYHHPDPRVQRRTEVLWLLSQGENQARSGQLAGVSKATVERYVAVSRKSGVARRREFHWAKPVGLPEKHRAAPEPEFRERPPHTVAEAVRRIEALTGVRRKETQVRAFLEKVSARVGVGWVPSRCPRGRRSRNTGTPRPPSCGTSWSRCWRTRGRGGGPCSSWTLPTSSGGRSCAACGAWCGCSSGGASGRRRYNVLGAWNGVTRELIRVTDDTRVSSVTMVELLGRVAVQAPGPTTLVLDNARYQRCEAVTAEAKRVGVELLFLPSYSPNRNLIERRW